VTSSKEFEELLAVSGVSLASLGIRDIGLSRSDALKGVEILRNAKLPILGGDAYFRHGERITLATANWYADPRPFESKEDYLSRSWDSAKTYITRFPQPIDAELLFSIVVGELVYSIVVGDGDRPGISE
jgi:hypothetical protein